MTAKKKSDPIGPQTMFDGDVLDIEGRRCLGTLKPVSEPKRRILFVQHAPESSEAKLGRPYSSKQSQLLLETLNGVGFDTSAAWFTYAVKYFAKSPAASDEKWCRGMLDDELRTINPDIVVVFGAEALRNIAGPASRYQISACRGAFVKVVDKNGENPLPYLVYPTFDLSQVLFNEQYEAAFLRDLKRLADRVNGTEPKVPEIKNHSLKSVEDLNALELALSTLAVHSGGHLLVALDCEWGGRNWMDPDRYFRTIQLGMEDVSTVYTIEIARENGVLFEPRQEELFAVIRKILEASYIDLVGHNIIADGEWLLSYGIDIRPRVVYDTMLAEYLIDSTGPFGLEELTMKYTDVGRYSWEVEVWCKQHKKTVEGPESYGYAQVPHEMLLRYAAWDVAALHLIMGKQMPILEERGYFERRGLRGEHPSMFDTTMDMQRVLYELEINGWPTDHAQLDMLTDRYGEARAKLLAEVMQMSRAIGFENFNPRSSDDIRRLLFGEEYLDLPPVKTTEGDSWADAVGNMGMDDEDASDVRAATDKTTLEILDVEHPMVHKLLQFKRIDQSCKTWLRRTDEKGAPAGLYKQLWADGNIHPHYSPLTQTGRLRTSNPNCFPGEVEVLTELGWLRWDDLYNRPDRDTVRLAQWDVDSLEITFAVPNHYVMHENAECVHIHSRQQIDVVCTPDHRFTVYDRKNTSRRKSLVARELQRHADFQIPQSGKLVKGGERLAESQVTVICALQADGYLVPEGGIDWRFTKQRKWYRLMDALKASGVAFRPYLRETAERDRCGVYVGKNDVPEWLKGRKKFGPWLFEYDSDTLSLFEKEVWLWDECASRKSMFASAIPENAGFVQALCLFNGRRGKVRKYVSNTGSTSWQVDAANHGYTQLANLSVEDAGRHTVYCVNMPKDTVIVRYNGKVAFTNQSQNLPKQAEAFMTDIFGKGNEPPVIRTIVKPRDGWVQLEGDFCQAELFTLANLSQDQNMLRALTTPGLDLHDKTATDAFGLTMIAENGDEVTEDDLIRLAREMGGADTDEYEHFMKVLTYVDQHGKRMTRAEFKSSIRVAAKAINFGIAYGRGAKAIALQVKAQTGDPRPVDEIVPGIALSLKSWKEVSYPQAWNWLLDQQQLVYDPGWIENPFGRRKWAHLRKNERNAAREREFGNFPIQSTVSDAVQIAMGRMLAFMRDSPFPFRLQNQIHDAVMIETPVEHIQDAKDMFQATLAGIDIPIPGTDRSFRLGIDIDVYERWGVKMK